MDAAERNSIIVKTSVCGVLVNIIVAAVKIIAGLLSSSVAIVSEGVNNAADALTSVLMLVGAKLAARHPDTKHPFGYGRIEYLTGLVVAGVILYSGAEMLRVSVKAVFKPEPLEVSYLSIVILAVTAVVKFGLGVYTMRRGKSVQSDALIGVGLDGRNDSFVSIVTIATTLIFLLSGLSLDAYAGILMSGLILKAGIEIGYKTVSELIGRPGEAELAAKLYARIRATPGIIGAADMMLHNYGPGAWSGSVNVEIDHERTVGDVYAVLHELQLKIMHEDRVTMVFGVYAVDNDHAESKAVRKVVAEFVRAHEHVKSFHAIYLDVDTKRLYCDLIVDYALKDWEGLRAEMTSYMVEHFPDRKLELTIETEFV